MFPRPRSTEDRRLRPGRDARGCEAPAPPAERRQSTRASRAAAGSRSDRPEDSGTADSGPEPRAEPQTPAEKELVSVAAVARTDPSQPECLGAAGALTHHPPPRTHHRRRRRLPTTTGTEASGNGSGNGKRATLVQPRPVAPAAGVPEGVRTQRLLTVVKARAIQQVKTEPTDKVNTWPHLMIGEFSALLAVTGVLIILSVILQAPLLDPANFNATPNPSKAPWYFLGLQELLSYFDPQIAGVTVPTIVGLIGFMAVPYVDRNPSTKPSDRKFAIMLYTIFMAGAATLTIFGVLFRGRGFNFSYPWKDGVFFDDLKDWVNFE